MADDSQNPFNTEVVAHDRILQIEKHLSVQDKEDNSRDRRQQDITDLLLLNHRNSYFSSSTDSSHSIALRSISDDDFNRLKQLLRIVQWPIDHPVRQQLWINLLTLTRVNSLNESHHHGTRTTQTAITTSTIMDNNFNCVSIKHENWPSFVDKKNLCFYYLTERRGQALVQGILLAFASYHPDVTYCPILEPISAVLLHYHNEYEVFYLINRLLIKNWLCGETRLQWEAHCNVFRKLLRNYYVCLLEKYSLKSFSCLSNLEIFS